MSKEKDNVRLLARGSKGNDTSETYEGTSGASGTSSGGSQSERESPRSARHQDPSRYEEDANSAFHAGYGTDNSVVSTQSLPIGGRSRAGPCFGYGSTLRGGNAGGATSVNTSTNTPQTPVSEEAVDVDGGGSGRGNNPKHAAGKWNRRSKHGVSDGEAILRTRNRNATAARKMVQNSRRKNGFSTVADRVKGYAEFQRLLASKGSLPFIKPSNFTVGQAFTNAFTQKEHSEDRESAIRELYDSDSSSDQSEVGKRDKVIGAHKWSADQLEDLREAFRTYLPDYMVEGPWDPLSIAMFVIFTVSVGFFGFWIFAHPEWAGNFMGENKLLRPVEFDLNVFRHQDSPALIHNVWAILAIRLVFCAASWTVLWFALKDTMWAITMYTMWSWSFMTLRWTLACLMSFITVFGGFTRITSTAYYRIETLYELLRFVSIVQNGTTVVIAVFVLIPLFYIILRMSDRPHLASDWLQVNCSYYNLVMHCLNFFPFALFEHVFINPRRFNAVDMWIGLLIGYVYNVFYLLVLDRNGLHFYPFLNPRSRWYCVGIVGLHLLMYMWLVCGNFIAGEAQGVRDAERGNLKVEKLLVKPHGHSKTVAMQSVGAF